MSLSLGELAAISRASDRVATATGLDRVRAAYEYYNTITYAARLDRARLWPEANRHLWRISAMYFGGDVAMGSFPGGKAFGRLWNYRQPAPNAPQTFDFEASHDTPFGFIAKSQRRRAAGR